MSEQMRKIMNIMESTVEEGLDDMTHGGWSLSTSPNEINLNNMINLRNSITVYKQKGYGDKEFYVGVNNQSAPHLSGNYSSLHRYIQDKYRKDPLPMEMWNAFVEKVKDYQ